MVDFNICINSAEKWENGGNQHSDLSLCCNVFYIHLNVIILPDYIVCCLKHKHEQV